MNNTDDQILSLLRENARISMTTIAERLKLSRTTIQKRIEHMESQGVILSYTTKIKPEFDTQVICAWMSIMVEGNRAREIINELTHYSTVNSLHTTNGKWDLLVELKAKNLEEFNTTLGNIRRIEGIYNTETSILLSTYKS